MSGSAPPSLVLFCYWWGSSTPDENGDNESLISGGKFAATLPPRSLVTFVVAAGALYSRPAQVTNE